MLALRELIFTVRTNTVRSWFAVHGNVTVIVVVTVIRFSYCC